MVIQRIKLNDKWYGDLRNESIGVWYTSYRGVYLIPDIIIDCISSGFDSSYNTLINLHESHPEIFSDDYQDIRDILLADEWIYEEYEKLEQWLNDSELFLKPSGTYIGMSENGDFGMWFAGYDINSFTDEQFNYVHDNEDTRDNPYFYDHERDTIATKDGEWVSLESMKEDIDTLILEASQEK